MKHQLITIALAVVVAGAFAMQFNALRTLQTKVTSLNQQLDSLQAEGRSAAEAPIIATEQARSNSSGNGGLQRRVSALEDSVAHLTRSSEYLMDRGQLPLAARKIEELHRTLAAAGTADRDRIEALRLLRRNQELTDDAVQHAMTWLNSATNSNVREDVLRQLSGLTNAVLREPFLRLAVSDTDADVRERAIENLRRFVTDPQVEAQLWQTLQNDPDGDVREQAEEALREGPMSEARLAGLRQRALDPKSSLDEQITAMRAMREANAQVPEVLASMVARAQNTKDPLDRARLFEAFDGLNDPVLAVPLVQGLQDANPSVRERAADALSGFNSDSTVQQWLRHVAETDADPSVRREALQALANRGR